MKETIIQGYTLWSPFWRAAPEAVKRYLSPLPPRPQQFCILSCCGRKKLPNIQVQLLFSIPLHSLCFLRYLLGHIVESNFCLQLHISRYYMAQSVKANKPFSFMWICFLCDPCSDSQSKSLKKQTAMREHIQPCVNTMVNIKKCS